MKLSRFIQNCTLSLSLLLASASVVAESPRNLEDILSRPRQETHEVSPDVIELEKKVKDYNRDTIQPKLNEKERRRLRAELEKRKEEEKKEYYATLGSKLSNLREHLVLKEDNYRIPFTIIIQPEGTLEIEPGTTLSFGPNGGIISMGVLWAVGKSYDQITFTADEDSWNNISILSLTWRDNNRNKRVGRAAKSRLEYCVIEKGTGIKDSTIIPYCERSIDGLSYVFKQYKNSSFGGGILTDTYPPTIRNCIIRNNSADYGGGICILGGGRSGPEKDWKSGENTTLFNCTIINNRANKNGGGIYQDSSKDVIGCQIRNNTATRGDGGGIWVSGYGLHLYNNTISDNTAGYNGGGILISASAGGEITDNTFKNNKAKYGTVIYRSGEVLNLKVENNHGLD